MTTRTSIAPPRDRDGNLLCSYCGRKAQYFSSSKRFYGGREYGSLWACIPCKAHVGCYRGSKRPLGRLAKRDLRKAKQEAHFYFDALWRKKKIRHGVSWRTARTSAYRWLASELGLNVDDCHIGYMDEAFCAKVVEACKPYAKTNEIPF